MVSKSLGLLVALLGASTTPLILAEEDATRPESAKSSPYEVLESLHYHNVGAFPIPSVANRHSASQFATTLVHFDDAVGERRFVISMSTGSSLDAQRLRLITQDKYGKFVPGLSFSVSSRSSGESQLITFIGHFKGDVRVLERLLVIRMNDRVSA